MLSKYCSNIAKKYDIKTGCVNKLIPNLGNKSKYDLHYKNRQLYLFLGKKIVSIYKVLKVKQSNWLNKCIEFDTDKIKYAANSFEKHFFK